MMLAGGDQDKSKEKYAPCCDLWHACYQICGVSKKSCDEGFKSCSKGNCLTDQQCQQAAEIDALMTQLSGCPKFEAAQQRACKCVALDGGDDNEAYQQREQVLTKFYEAHAPDQISKVSALAEKSCHDHKRLAGLFRKLLQKYPKAIQRIEDPEAGRLKKMMDEINKKGPPAQNKEE